MKKTILALCLFSVAASASAIEFTDTARVISAQPVYEQVNVQECADVPVTTVQPASDGTGGAIVGGIVGGLLGHQVGGGSGKTAATIVGAIAGSMAGKSLAANPTETETTSYQRQCHTTPTERAAGYNVTYEYRGQQDTIRLPYNPGSRLDIRVTAMPITR